MNESTSNYPRIIFHSGSKPEDVVLAPALAGAIVQRGTTAHFVVSYDSSLGASGPVLADAVLGTCEADYSRLQGWFGNVAVGGLPFHVMIQPGNQGARHDSCAATGITCDAFGGVDADLVRFVLVAEVDEVLMANQNAGWNCGGSAGEALSRVLAAEIYPNELRGFATGRSWLVTSRPNWVDQPEGTDLNVISTGCGTLFINWLRFQLGFSLNQIVQTGGNTLAKTYFRLTRRTDAFDRFLRHIAVRFPAGSSGGLTTDNPFPYAVPPDPDPFPPVAPAVVPTTSPKKAICALTSGNRLAQVFDSDHWSVDFPAELAGQGGLRFKAVAVVQTTPPKKSIIAVTDDGRLAQVFDTDHWTLDFPAELAGQGGLRFKAVAVVQTTPPKKSIIALTNDDRLAQVFDTDRWNLDFPAELAGQAGLRFKAIAVVQTTPAKKSIIAITTNGRLAQVFDTDRWNLDFPVELALS